MGPTLSLEDHMLEKQLLMTTLERQADKIGLLNNEHGGYFKSVDGTRTDGLTFTSPYCVYEWLGDGDKACSFDALWMHAHCIAFVYIASYALWGTCRTDAGGIHAYAHC